MICFIFIQKTYSMIGPQGGRSEHNGLYVLASRDLFHSLQSQAAFKQQKLQVYVSFFEIYGGKLYDLLAERRKLISREDAAKSVNIVGLKEKKVHNATQVMECITHGNSVRSTGQTGANIDSSRSHAILQITIKRIVEKSSSSLLQGKKVKQIYGRMSFIDLAGSEKGSEVNTASHDRKTRIEGAEINKSLLALKECIRALDQGGKHLPFRGSQLTQVLKDSFGPNSRTLMLANISPNDGSVEHTLNTLRYANRVKELKKEGGNDNSSKNPALFNAYMPHQQKKLNVASNTENGNKGNNSKRLSSSQDGGFGAFALSRAAAAASSKDQLDEFDSVETERQLLERTHSELCATILAEEDELIHSHRSALDQAYRSLTDERSALDKFQLSQCGLDEYVRAVEESIDRRVNEIRQIQKKFRSFRERLNEEEKLIKSVAKWKS
jgi:kinesin family protein 2/24